MEHVYWIHENAVGGRPGPNLIPWDLNALREGGIRAILPVNDGELVHEDELQSAGIEYQCTPLSEDAPPRPGDLAYCLSVLPTAYEFVSTRVALSQRVLVHCRQGRDRTGLFLAYYCLKHFGVSSGDALTRLKHMRPDALSAPGWNDFALEVLRAS